jgi:hypothetical protein
MDWLYYFSVWSDGLKKRHETVFTRISISLQQRAEVAPVEYETIKEEIKKKKIEAQRKSRITVCFSPAYLWYRLYITNLMKFLFFFSCSKSSKYRRLTGILWTV